MNETKEHGGYVLKVREETTRALATLKSENERFRMQLAAVESDRARLHQEKLNVQEQLMITRDHLTRSVDDHSSLVRRLMDVERENERVAGQFLDIETQNANLANLYVASYQLHGSLDRDEIVAAIREIVINLIGCEDFGIYERVDDEEKLRLIGWFDVSPESSQLISFGEGIVGRVAATGEAIIDEHGRSGIVAAVPLSVNGRVAGVIALFRLLPQKGNSLERLDHELLNLLASQAGIALYSTALHADATRRRAEGAL